MKEKSMTDKDAKYVLGVNRGPFPDSAEVEHVEIVSKKPKARAQRVKRHFARFWCCYLFWNVIFLAIFLPCFFLLAIPAISQLVVNNSKLVLIESSVLEPRPDSVLLTMRSELKLPFGLPVRIDPITLNLFNRDQKPFSPYAKLYLDGTTIKRKATLGVTNQHTPLLDQGAWQEYVNSVVFTKQAPLSLKGSTDSFLGKLKSHVTMDKDLPQFYLNSFEGFSLADTRLLIPAQEDGTNLLANATLPNPSVLTLEIGTTLMDVKSGDLVLGNVTIDNLVIRPGNHSVPLHGILDLHTLIENLPELIQTQREALRNGYLELQTVGRSAIWHGQLVPYYTNSLKNLTMTARVPVRDLLVNTLRGLPIKNGTNLLSTGGSNDPGAGLLDDLDLSSLTDTLRKRSSVLEMLENMDEEKVREKMRRVIQMLADASASKTKTKKTAEKRSISLYLEHLDEKVVKEMLRQMLDKWAASSSSKETLDKRSRVFDHLEHMDKEAVEKKLKQVLERLRESARSI